MPEKTAKITFDNQTVELPISPATLGYSVIGVKPISAHQHFTFDPGFYATAACESKITYIDGEKGVLLYRGYPIDQLASDRDYLDVCYLLIYGELPSDAEKAGFEKKIQEAAVTDDLINKFFEGFPRDAHPMGMLLGVVGALSTFYHDKLDISKKADREMAIIHLIAKIPVIAAMTYRHNQNKPFLPPKSDCGYAENFLHMLFGDESTKASDPVLIKAMDRIFTLHADHEQNASTATVRMAGSTGTDPFAAIAAGISALWGPAHGGANEACLNMLKEIGDEAHIEKIY